QACAPQQRRHHPGARVRGDWGEAARQSPRARLHRARQVGAPLVARPTVIGSRVYSRHLAACLAVLLLGCATRLAAQAEGAPLRFGVAWSGASNRGDLAAMADGPAGFTAQLSLPITRSSPLGIRAEFSVLTFPERLLRVPAGFGTAELEVSARGTISFTGAGPRLEARAGSLAIAGAVMGGFVRMITDVSGRAMVDEVRSSASISESDYSFALQAGSDGPLAADGGVQGGTIGWLAGGEMRRGGRVACPAGGSMRMPGAGAVTIGRPLRTPELLVLRAGVGVEF